MKHVTKTPRKVTLLTALSLLLCLGLFVGLGATNPKSEDLSELRKTGQAFTSVARKAFPAVVFIKVEKKVDRPNFSGQAFPFDDDLLRRFFGDRLPQPRAPRGEDRVSGQGSGFITSPDGYILTNHHVVKDADKVTVKLSDGRELLAKVVGADARSDVALLKVEAKDLPALKLGNSEQLEVGEWVVAVGNPFGLSNTVTSGIVSAKERTQVGIADYESFIQTDAAINPGNSGGPLLNLDAEVVGINTAIFSRTGGNMGIGFAIPINMVKNIRDQLVKTGTVTRGYLGVLIQQLTPDLAETFGADKATGVLIGDLTKDSPAKRAGMKKGDIVVELNGRPVKDVGSFRNRIAMIAPGEEAKLVVLRDGKRTPLTVKIGQLPSDGIVVSGSPKVLDRLGLTVQELTPQLAEQLGHQGEAGVVVSQVASGSPAARVGIRTGSLIQEVNRKAVTSISEFKKALGDLSEKKSVLFLIKDGDNSRYVVVKLES